MFETLWHNVISSPIVKFINDYKNFLAVVFISILIFFYSLYLASKNYVFSIIFAILTIIFLFMTFIEKIYKIIDLNNKIRTYIENLKELKDHSLFNYYKDNYYSIILSYYYPLIQLVYPVKDIIKNMVHKRSKIITEENRNFNFIEEKKKNYCDYLKKVYSKNKSLYPILLGCNYLILCILLGVSIALICTIHLTYQNKVFDVNTNGFESLFSVLIYGVLISLFIFYFNILLLACGINEKNTKTSTIESSKVQIEFFKQQEFFEPFMKFLFIKNDEITIQFMLICVILTVLRIYPSGFLSLFAIIFFFIVFSIFFMGYNCYYFYVLPNGAIYSNIYLSILLLTGLMGLYAFYSNIFEIILFSGYKRRDTNGDISDCAPAPDNITSNADLSGCQLYNDESSKTLSFVISLIFLGLMFIICFFNFFKLVCSYSTLVKKSKYFKDLYNSYILNIGKAVKEVQNKAIEKKTNADTEENTNAEAEKTNAEAVSKILSQIVLKRKNEADSIKLHSESFTGREGDRDESREDIERKPTKRERPPTARTQRSIRNSPSIPNPSIISNLSNILKSPMSEVSVNPSAGNLVSAGL